MADISTRAGVVLWIVDVRDVWLPHMWLPLRRVSDCSPGLCGVVEPIALISSSAEVMGLMVYLSVSTAL